MDGPVRASAGNRGPCAAQVACPYVENSQMLRSFARQLSTRTRRQRSFRSAGRRLEVMQLDARITPTVTEMAGFTGLNNTGWTPPDPNLAVGPSYVVATVNESMAIY